MGRKTLEGLLFQKITEMDLVFGLVYVDNDIIIFSFTHNHRDIFFPGVFNKQGIA